MHSVVHRVHGGLPLQVLWTALDLITIVVLGSGLWLWWAKHRAAPTARRRIRGTAPRPAGRLRRSTWAAPVALAVVGSLGFVAGPR